MKQLCKKIPRQNVWTVDFTLSMPGGTYPFFLCGLPPHPSLTTGSDPILSFDQRIAIAEGAAEGIRYLHESLDILHRWGGRVGGRLGWGGWGWDGLGWRLGGDGEWGNRRMEGQSDGWMGGMEVWEVTYG